MAGCTPYVVLDIGSTEVLGGAGVEGWRVLPEYVGKMQFYLVALDDLARMADENPSIGIILCKSKDKTIGVATYRIVSTLPSELQGQLPAPEQIAKLLEDV